MCSKYIFKNKPYFKRVPTRSNYKESPKIYALVILHMIYSIFGTNANHFFLKEQHVCINPELVIRRCFVKKAFLIKSQNSQGNICARVSSIYRYTECLKILSNLKFCSIVDRHYSSSFALIVIFSINDRVVEFLYKK